MNIGAKAAAGDGDRFVLMLIGGGIIALILAVIVTMAVATLPEWAESVLARSSAAQSSNWPTCFRRSSRCRGAARLGR
jgi:hypothetical protein